MLLVVLISVGVLSAMRSRAEMADMLLCDMTGATVVADYFLLVASWDGLRAGGGVRTFLCSLLQQVRYALSRPVLVLRTRGLLFAIG